MDKASDNGASTRSPRKDKNKDNPNEPAVIGNYKIDRTLGQGTYGKVKLGIHQQSSEKVAIKIIEKSNIQSQRQVARIQREIRFLKLLHHPHIVKVYEVHETTEQIFIIMENVQGGELFDYIVSHKRVKEKEARVFYRMMLSALHYCHANAVIHRDLKPENLLLDNDKTIKIIDFGFGNTFKPHGLLETFCGSPFYAAPEMILGKKYEGPEVDMWSIGVILFALLCGHLPFDDENIKELYKKIAAGSFSCPNYLSSTAKHLIQRLITVDPRKRATLDEVLNHAWVNEGFTKSPHSFLPERPVIHDPSLLSQDIVNRLNAFSYSKEEIEKAFLEEDHSKPHPVRSTYFLLQEMLAREEKKLRDQKKAGSPAKPNLHSNLSSSQTTLTSQINTTVSNQTPGSVDSTGMIPAAVLINTPTKSDPNHPITSLTESSSMGGRMVSTGPASSSSDSPINSSQYIAGIHAPPNSALGVPSGPEVTSSLYSISEDEDHASTRGRTNKYTKQHNPMMRNISSNLTGQPVVECQINTLGISAANKGNFTSMPQVVVASDSKYRRASTPHTHLNQDNCNKQAPTASNLVPIHIPEQPRHSTACIATTAQSASPTLGPNSYIPTVSPPSPSKEAQLSPSSANAATHDPHQYTANPGSPDKSGRRFSLATLTSGNKRRSNTTPANPLIPSTDTNNSNGGDQDGAMLVSGASNEGSSASENARTMNSWFLNVNTTSAKPVADIMIEVKRVLKENHVECSHDGVYMIMCKMADLVFEIEICKVPRLSLFGLHFKRISGGIWTYKKLCNKLLSQMNL